MFHFVVGIGYFKRFNELHAARRLETRIYLTAQLIHLDD